MRIYQASFEGIFTLCPTFLHVFGGDTEVVIEWDGTLQREKDQGTHLDWVA